MNYDERPNNEGLQEGLTALLNSYSRENASNTPDWILAHHLISCLEAFEKTVRRRAEWYDRHDEPGQP